MKKYIIFLVCLCVIAVVLGFSVNLSYEDFSVAGDYLTDSNVSVDAELIFIRKVSSWLSVYSFSYGYHMDTSRDLETGDVDVEKDFIGILIDGNYTFIIGKEAYDAGVGYQLEIIASLLTHDPLDLNIQDSQSVFDFFNSLQDYVAVIFVLLRLLIAILFIVVFFILNTFLVAFELLKVLLFLIGFTDSL